nr:pollen-specific leucine-rich repeat extensin-like protein 3 [Ciona intestinalis]|eukprot:XP_009862355.2 pollen-specific leucine-rich repeat extensin-like protein 3 [Ciona intestinalis]
MRPRRRRRKRSPTRKRSRRKSRSYSRSRSRSYSPSSRGRSPKRESSHSKPDANVKQKIHINPHFKGPRAIYTASHKTLSVSQTTVPSKTATVPPLFSMPPPNLLSRIPPPPLPNILIPPPKPTTESVPTSLSAPLAFNPKIPPPPIIAPPNPQAQPPMAPPPVNIQPPNPRVPPPSLPRVPQPFPTRPPNFTPNQGPPPTKPLVHIQHPITQGIPPSSNGQGILPLPPNARLINPTLGQPQVPQPHDSTSGRLKPPPLSTRPTINSMQPQVPSLEEQQSYASLVEKQAMERKKFLAMKEARRRGITAPNDVTRSLNEGDQLSGKIRIINLSSTTRPDTIMQMMNNMGAFKDFTYDVTHKLVTAKFINPQHAQDFLARYNRQPVDSSPIVVTLDK